MAIAAERIDSREKLSSLLEHNNEALLTCVHCGLCLPSCPTYRELGNENDSPRGRIYLMRRVVEGQLEVGDTFISHIDLCLGCRACESSCPSGVPYGQLLEAARVEVSEAKSRRGSISEYLLRFVLKHIFTRPVLLGAAMALARWLRDSGLARLAFDSHLVGGRLRFALALLLASRSPLKGTEVQDGASDQADAEGATRVALLRGCVMEGLFAEANRATERTLARNGCRIVEAKDQMCCGALHAHAGQLDTAKELARKNIEAFSPQDCDWIIVNSAGCGATMKEYGELLADDPDYRERALKFASKVRDVSEFLIERGMEPPAGKVERRVAYDAPCHLLYAQRIAQPAVELLKAVPAIRLVPLRGSENCCGGAGIYNLQHTDLSAKILSDKIESIRASGADTIATANPGCIMQIGAGLLLDGLDADVIHPIELLDAAYQR